jgi:hypothetical protein
MKLEDHPTRVNGSNLSESAADQSVLIFYKDGEYAQRHSIADCARLRASTLGSTDKPHHNNLPAVWHEEKTVGGNGQPNPSSIHDLAACSKVVVIDGLKPLRPQHILNDCAFGDVYEIKDAKQHPCELLSLENCPADVGTTRRDTTGAAVDNPSSVEQHLLNDCAIDVFPKVTKAKPAEV